jgi:hypothetical protein
MPPSPPRLATTRDEGPSPSVSVVIPALNEETNLPLVLEGLPPVDEVVIVDGGSADDTVAIAREVRPDAVVVRQTRTGKGNALVCGFAASNGDIVVTLNADGSTDPGELPRFVDALISGAEVAHGSRFRDGGGDLGGDRLDRVGNAILSSFVNALFGTRFTDLGYGYNAYWRAVLPALDLPGVQVPGLKRGRRAWGDGPEIEPLINIRVAAQGMRVVEVASIGYPPINGTRERQGLQRASRALRVAVAEYVRRWRIGPRPAAPEPADPGARSRAAAAGRRPAGTGAGSGDWRTDTGARSDLLRSPAGSGIGGGEWRTDTGTGRRRIPPDSNSRRRGEDTGSGRPGQDTGSGRPGQDTGSGRPGQDTGSGRRGEDTGSGRRGRGDWRENTDTGQWRDLTGAVRPPVPEGPMYDPAADEQHDLDPAARRSLPMYPAADPWWTETSGRHAAIGDATADRRRQAPGRRPPTGDPRGGARRRGYPDGRVAGAAGPAPWEGSSSDTGQHHRIDPDADDEPREPGRTRTPREVGERRRRLEAWEHRTDERPDLTVITGAGWASPDPNRPGHLRAIPGERSTR